MKEATSSSLSGRVTWPLSCHHGRMISFREFIFRQFPWLVENFGGNLH